MGDYIILYRADYHNPPGKKQPVLKVNPSLIFNGAISGFVGARGSAGLSRGGNFDDFSSLADLFCGWELPMFDHQLVIVSLYLYIIIWLFLIHFSSFTIYQIYHVFI